MKILAASLMAISVVASAPQKPSIDYRFDEVRRSVTLTTATQHLAVQRGNLARSGDRVQTGWFSYALIASEQHRAKFEIFSSTTVQLAGGTPGVILSLERGKLHAMFDKITGDEPRVVKTPGALLAVRGTQYDVGVDEAGQTTLNVTEGVVEVRSEMRPEPLFVHAGETCNYSRHESPIAHPRGQNQPMQPRNGREGSDGEHRPGDPNDPGRPGMPPPGMGKPGMPTTPPPQGHGGH
jgi:FecR protein